MAKQWLEHDADESDEEWTPPLTDWDTSTAIGAEQRDLLQDVVKLLVGIRHGLPVVQVDRLRPTPKVGGKPFPRPVTAIDRARENAAHDAAQQVLAWFFPHASNN